MNDIFGRNSDISVCVTVFLPVMCEDRQECLCYACNAWGQIGISVLRYRYSGLLINVWSVRLWRKLMRSDFCCVLRLSG